MGARERKRALRDRLKEVRAGIDADDRERWSKAIESAVIELPEVAEATTVMAFASFGTEVSTAGLVDRLRAAGKRVHLPFVVAPEVMEAAEVLADAGLVPSTYGPREPEGLEPVDPRAIDVILVPGLGFDEGGRRLGYGGGFYDRFRRRLRPDAVRVGLAFDVQVVGEPIPVRPSDEVVEVVVTERRVLRIEPRRPGLKPISAGA